MVKVMVIVVDGVSVFDEDGWDVRAEFKKLKQEGIYNFFIGYVSERKWMVSLNDC